VWGFCCIHDQKDAVMKNLFSVRANNSRNISSKGNMMSVRVILCSFLLLIMTLTPSAAAADTMFRADLHHHLSRGT